MSGKRFNRAAPWVALFTAVAIVVVLTTLMVSLQPLIPYFLSVTVVALAYLLAINFVTQLTDLVPGVVAAVLSFFSFNYFFIEPRGTLYVNSEQDWLILIIFLVVALINNQVLVRAQRGWLQAQSREQDISQFYGLSLALIGLLDEQSVAKTLSQKLAEMFGAEAVEVRIQSPSSDTALTQVIYPDEQRPNGAQPCHRETLSSARHTFGEISVWGPNALTPREQQSLRTFAATATLVLDRIQTNQLENRSKFLEESDQLKSSLLSSVSHELRTPLATIRAAAQSLRRGLVSPQSSAGQGLIADVDDAAEHLSRLVSNILDMSRIESGALKPRREWTDIGEVIESTLAHMRTELSQHDVQVNVPEELPLLPVDPVQMDQVFTNLVGNSAKYAPVGSSIRIAAWPTDDGFVQISVANQSPALPSDHLERIFDKYYRVTNADRVSGTGLGLSICKGIVAAHGGHIWAVNQPTAQDRFAFMLKLPLKWAGAASQLPAPELPTA